MPEYKIYIDKMVRYSTEIVILAPTEQEAEDIAWDNKQDHSYEEATEDFFLIFEMTKEIKDD